MNHFHPFAQFLETFVPKVATKNRQLNLARWWLETTGSVDAAELATELDIEFRLLFHDASLYQQLETWAQDASLKDPLLLRQLNVLIRTFKQNCVPQELLTQIAKKEAHLTQIYANFRPEINGIPVSENEIREILKRENNPALRWQAWEASKEIGPLMAPEILQLVRLRNQAAQSLGYPDYFKMQLELQEVDESWLNATFDALADRSDQTYQELICAIEKEQSQRFQVPLDALGPWAWSEPFCQEDPLGSSSLDSLVEEVDICEEGVAFYQRMGIDVAPIYQRSDMFEREGKNQHAFCTNIDRETDVRTLNNVKPTLKWLETVLHEFGHGVYELGFDRALPWLLREPPHMITTEAMALMAGRQAYHSDLLKRYTDNPLFLQQAKESLRRRQLIFSRWVLVMTHFERELYQNPDQDLNKLWIHLVEKYQRIKFPQGREEKCDWATKFHIALAPVYYYSYLLGEMFASAIEETIANKVGASTLDSPETGQFLKERLFKPGNRIVWTDLVKEVLGHPLTHEAWLRQFVTKR